MPQVGELIPLSLKLPEAATDKFVKATLRNDAGAQIAGSPGTLTHVGEGQYTNNTFLMPAGTDYVNVAYQVFDDAGFTQPSALYSDAQERFELDIPDAEFLALLLEIKAMLTGLTASSSAASDVRGVIQKVDALLGVVIAGTNLTGVMNQPTVVGTIDDGEDVTGTINVENLVGETK